MIPFLLALLGGALTWTLLEYLIHRFLGHDSRFRGNPFGVEHLRHHAEEGFFGPALKKAAVAVPVAALAWGLGGLIAGVTLGLAYMVGLMGTYLGYEVLHRLEHRHAGIGPYGRWARKHHFYHHFGNPNKNHGVTSPLWDLVFRTYERPGQIVVPRSLVVPWMLDPETSDIRGDLAQDYRLRGKRRPTG